MGAILVDISTLSDTQVFPKARVHQMPHYNGVILFLVLFSSLVRV